MAKTTETKASKASTKTKGGELRVTSTYKNATNEHHEIIARTFPTDAPIATVSVEGSVTKNLGNYESIRIQASITLPCLIDETSDAYDEAWRRVEEQLTKKVEQVTSK
jgi:hypothetical protein